MVFSDEDKVLIKNLYLIKGYGARKLISEFPEKNWKKSGLDKLLKKLRETGTVEREKGSGRPKTTRTAENVSTVDELTQSGKPTTISSFCRGEPFKTGPLSKSCKFCLTALL